MSSTKNITRKAIHTYDSGNRNQHTFGKKFAPKHAPSNEKPKNLHPI